ncbi:MAG: tetratricopeptide repeat protein, partial [Gemmatimonadota bacterium]
MTLRRSPVALCILSATSLGRVLGAQVTSGCASLTPAQIAQVDSGWQQYRQGATDSAAVLFGRVLRGCPTHVGASNGSGYVALRRGDLQSARAHFQRALEQDSLDYDALVGSGLTSHRAGDLLASREAFSRALRVLPGDSLSVAHLEQIAASLRATEAAVRRPPERVRPQQTVIAARARQRTFEVANVAGNWNPLWIAGVNLGAALPGKHPSEFPPNDSTYERWIELCAQMHANVIRVYTIHPPHFYQALRRWNLAHPERPIWLIHGVWTELPPGEHEERYDDSTWNAEFRAEMRRVVDLLHGSASLPPRPGHASGYYEADVSPWVLAYIIGREWEPYSVVEYVKRKPGVTKFRGRYVTVDRGNALDVWLGEALEHLIAYEMQRYNAQRPVAYTNWPTLDPLTHITESTKEEEAALYAARGEARDSSVREYDNDAIGLDARVMRATPRFKAGLFASYHAYPYYPDFMVLDPQYNRAASPEGPSAYFGYLKELVAHHADMPVLISEYGVPSSRGMAHWQPQGWHHGGHDEQAQADIDARLTRDIHASGAAGAVLFATIDEWFKKNWLVIDFEFPLERNRLWLNPIDAEQNYGIVAMRPGHRDSIVTIDGKTSDWRGTTPLYSGDTLSQDALGLRSFSVRSDEAYLYLRLDVGRIDWTQANYLVGIDTYRADLGDKRLPYTGTIAQSGFEFVLELRGRENSRLLVD